MKKSMLLIFLSLLISCSVFAGELEDGTNAYKKGDYVTTLKLFRKLALEGNAIAQLAIGFMYSKGEGVTQDYKEALKWFRLAAEQGDWAAQLSIAAMYENGQGVLQDYRRAHMWANIASINGDANAVKYRDDLTKKMTQQQIEKAQALASKCMANNYKHCD